MPQDPFCLRGKLVLLRFSRLGRLPPALYGAEILAENAVPLLVIEFGAFHEKVLRVDGAIPRLRFESPWARWLPHKARALAIFLSIFIRVGRLMANEGKPKLIFAHGLQEQALAFLFKVFFGVPYAVHVHEVFDKHELTIANRVYFQLEGPALRGAKFLIFPEATRANIYRERYRLNNPIYLAFNCPRLRFQGSTVDLRARYHLPSSAVLLLYMGGLSEINCLKEGIRSLASVPNVCFLIAGWGEPEVIADLKKTAAEAGVQSRVLLLGPIDNRWEFYDNSDIAYCVYRPTATLRIRHGATASNKLMEAMASGLPLITSNNNDFKEFLHKYEVGVAVSEVSVPAIAARLRELADDEVRRKRYGATGLEWHRRIFNYENQFAPILQEFYRLVGPQSLATESGSPSDLQSGN